jgi:microcystin-dependent protein
MSSPYVGEIRMFAGNFAPAGWMFCDGRLIPISDNETLFNLIGTTYGGDGQETFALPDLRGQVPVHSGTGGGQTLTLGETGGVESVLLTVNQIPNHTHPLSASANPADANIATAGSLLASLGPAGTQSPPIYRAYDGTAQVTMNAAITPAGGSQPHDNFQPTLAVSYIISLFGIFPSQN